LPHAVYGLVERHRDALKKARLVAVPGCYPTASILALAPLLDARLVRPEGIIIDAKSGVSGAGREPQRSTHFSEIGEGVRAYKVAGHRHTPEIEQELYALGADVTVTFIPHLLPLDQGELVSCYVTLDDGADDGELERLYAEAYGHELFVELAPTPPGVRDVRETNICRVSVHRDLRPGRAIVFAAIDNLWKGAAGQAIQNLNLMLGFDETEGLR